MAFFPFLALLVAYLVRGDVPSFLQIVDFEQGLPIDATPRFSWINNFDGYNKSQSAYQIVVSKSSKTVWDSGIVRSQVHLPISYRGPTLQPATKYSWKVRTWDNSNDLNPLDGNESFSKHADFTTGFFDPGQWDSKTRWIAAPQQRVGVTNSFWIPANNTVIKSFELPAGTVLTAQTSFTGTSALSLAVNQVNVLRNTTIWSTTVTDIDITPYLKAGQNNITLIAPAGAQGVILRSEIRIQGQDLILLTTDSTWTTETGQAATVIAPYYNAPWSTWKMLTTGGSVIDQPVTLRRDFRGSRHLVSANLFISGLGQFEAYLNAKKIGNYFINQAWTDYEKRVTYTVYDVSSLILEGSTNSLGVQLGNGWYDYQTGSITKRWGLNEATSPYIKSYGIMRLWCELRLLYADGTTQIVSSNKDWKSSTSPWTLTSVYGSETYDFRLESKGWAAPNFNDSSWSAVHDIEPPAGVLRAQRTPPLKIQKSYSAELISSGAAYALYDIGKNINGLVEISTIGSAAVTYNMVGGEKLQSGRVYPIGSAANATSSGKYITYTKVTTAGTNVVETYRQGFSTSGFRYIEVQSVDSNPLPTILNVTGHWVYANAVRAGTFDSNDSTFNRIYDMVLRTMLNNFVSIHTDCPQYEKLGWQEVVASLTRSYSFTFHTAPWISNILSNTRESQQSDGLIPTISPIFAYAAGNYLDAPLWGHSIIQGPWLSYQMSGDVQILQDNFAAAVAYYGHLKSRASNNRIKFGLGDWVSPSGTQVLNAEGAVFVYGAGTLARIASVLGQRSLVDYFNAEFKTNLDAYNAAFFQYNNCSYYPPVQANQAIPFAYNLLPENTTLTCVGAAMVDIIQNPRVTADLGYGSVLSNHIAVGEMALLPLLNSLQKMNRNDLVEMMITQPDVPSFRALLLANETTLPEQWNYGSARSQNHDMFATLMEWFYTAVGGIQETKPGFSTFAIQPGFNMQLKNANISFESVHGTILSSWEKTSSMSNGTTVRWKIQVPSDTEAEVFFPGNGTAVKLSGRRLSADMQGVNSWPQANHTPWGDWTVGRFGSGSYTFEFDKL